MNNSSKDRMPIVWLAAQYMLDEGVRPNLDVESQSCVAARAIVSASVELGIYPQTAVNHSKNYDLINAVRDLFERLFQSGEAANYQFINSADFDDSDVAIYPEFDA